MKSCIAFATGLALLSCARGSAPAGGELQRALAAVEMCYHWAGEAGSGDAERERQVREGAERDCAEARTLSTRLQRRFPDDPALALGILRLNDVGTFDLPDTVKARLCARAALAERDSTSASVMPDQATLCGR